MIFSRSGFLHPNYNGKRNNGCDSVPDDLLVFLFLSFIHLFFFLINRNRNRTVSCGHCGDCCVCASLQGDNTELMPPTPPPRRVLLGLGSGCMTATPSPVQHAPSFSRIASGLKLAQAQAMAVAGFLPEPLPYDWPVGSLQPSASDTEGTARHARCSLLNHRASFHGRG